MNERSSRWLYGLPAEVMLVLALFPKVLFCQTEQALPLQDFQTWTSFDASHRINSKTDFLLGGEIRYSVDQNHLNYRRITTGFAFRWHKYFVFEPYYQFSASDSYSGGVMPENRLDFAATVETPWQHWLISDRNLGERLFRQPRPAWRYRNRLELRRPIVIVHKHLSIFAWDEGYYSSLPGRWYRNRTAMGAGRKLGKGFSVDVFFVHQVDNYDVPASLNALGITVRTHF